MPRSPRHSPVRSSARGRRAAGSYPASAAGYGADELILFADNDEPCYRQAQEIRKNLLRKVKAGKYSKALAPKVWLYWADNASERYGREVYRMKGHAFNVADRKAAAKAAADAFDRDLAGVGGAWGRLADEYGIRGERGLKAARGRRASAPRKAPRTGGDWIIVCGTRGVRWPGALPYRSHSSKVGYPTRAIAEARARVVNAHYNRHTGRGLDLRVEHRG